jgi:hypothetical protein
MGHFSVMALPPLVVINNFDIEGSDSVIRPFKTYAPLLVDANAELSLTVAV